MDDNPDNSRFELELETLADLDRTRKWTMFLAILGFIGIGAFLIIGLFTGAFLSVFNKGDSASSYPVWLVFIIIISTSVLCFFPVLFIFRFSKFISNALKSDNKSEIKNAFKNLRSYFTYTGVVVIALLVIYVIAFLLMGSWISFLK